MLSALHKCSSPFLKLRVHLLNSLPLPGWDPVLWSIFLKLAQSAGLNCALKSLPAAYRKEASSILASSTSSQMEFQSCFSAWPKLIKDLGLQSGGPQGDFLGGSYSGIAA